MIPSNSLNLYHEILLLSLHDQEGTDVASQYLFALSGAILAELVLAERIAIKENDEHTVEVIDESSLHSHLLDQCLSTIATSDQPQSLGYWIEELTLAYDLKSLIANELCQQKILRRDENNVLWAFSETYYPELDPKPEREIKSRLEKLLFADEPEIDERTLILASLADSANLLEHNLGVLRVNEYRPKINEIEKHEYIGRAVENVRRAISENQVMFKLVKTLNTIKNS